MTDQPPITLEQCLAAIDKYKARLEINTIRYNDIQNRISREDTSMSKRAELVAKEKGLEIEADELKKNMNILIEVVEKTIVREEAKHVHS